MAPRIRSIAAILKPSLHAYHSEHRVRVRAIGHEKLIHRRQTLRFIAGSRLYLRLEPRVGDGHHHAGRVNQPVLQRVGEPGEHDGGQFAEHGDGNDHEMAEAVADPPVDEGEDDVDDAVHAGHRADGG